MPKPDLVLYLCRQNIRQLTQSEKLFFEVVLITRIYKEQHDVFRSRYRSYQILTKGYSIEGEFMCGFKFIQEMMTDILSTKEYSLAGIANYTHIPEEVITDIASGLNDNPTFELSRRIFELHASVRRELYDDIMKKIISEFRESA